MSGYSSHPSLYVKLLFELGLGYALYEPNTAGYGSDAFDKVRVGDVGYLNPEGAFIRLFNICHEANHEINQNRRRPSNFEPIAENCRGIGTYASRPAGLYRSSTMSSKGIGFDANVAPNSTLTWTAGASLELTCEKEQGVALFIRTAALRSEAAHVDEFARYFLTHYGSWRSSIEGIDFNRLILVTGCDLTNEWATAVFKEVSRSAKASFHFRAPLFGFGSSAWGKWQSQLQIPLRCGPDDSSPFSQHISPMTEDRSPSAPADSDLPFQIRQPDQLTMPGTFDSTSPSNWLLICWFPFLLLLLLDHPRVGFALWLLVVALLDKYSKGDKYDQCIFIRGFRVVEKLRITGKEPELVKLADDAAEFQDPRYSEPAPSAALPDSQRKINKWSASSFWRSGQSSQNRDICETTAQRIFDRENTVNLVLLHDSDVLSLNMPESEPMGQPEEFHIDTEEIESNGIMQKVGIVRWQPETRHLRQSGATLNDELPPPYERRPGTISLTPEYFSTLMKRIDPQNTSYANEELVSSEGLTHEKAAGSELLVDEEVARSEPLLEEETARTGWSTEEDALDDVLLKLKHFNLTHKVRNISERIYGLGSFCDIFRGEMETKDATTLKVAVRRPRKLFSQMPDFGKQEANEIIVWSLLLHPNINRFLGFILEEGRERPSLISEWYEGGTVDKYVKENPECDLKGIVTGIAEGLAYLHRSGIAHGNLKGTKVLITSSGVPRLTGFNLSRILEYSKPDDAGTTRWMAPELLRGDEDEAQKTKESDMWAFGMIIYEIISGKFPYAGARNVIQVVVLITEGALPEKPRVDSDEKEILWEISTDCWRLDPKERITIDAALEKLRSVRTDRPSTARVEANWNTLIVFE